MERTRHDTALHCTGEWAGWKMKKWENLALVNQMWATWHDMLATGRADIEDEESDAVDHRVVALKVVETMRMTHKR